MNCQHCAFENPQEAKFCSECGRSLSLHCPRCNQPVLPEGNFCYECGYQLSPTIRPHGLEYKKPETYTPRYLAEKIRTSRSLLEGERKLVSVLFADVVNYTAIAERLDPEDTYSIIDRCWKVLMQEIHKYEGTILQFLGDGIVALFGAPVAHEDHAIRACYAALLVQKAATRFAERIRGEYGVDLRMRIGINSGLVVLTSIGDDLHMEYSAIGDTMNLAERLQSAARPGSSLASHSTYKLAKDFFHFQPLPKLAVKGKEQPVDAYEIIDASEVETRIGAAAARGFSRFVGRGAELQTLLGMFERVKSGPGQIVGVVGEAGVGKTRLAFEFRKMLAGRDYGYLEGRCLHFGATIAYLPLLDILRNYFGIKEGAGERDTKSKIQEKISGLDNDLDYLLPALHELFSVTVTDDAFASLNPRRKRDRIFDAIRDLLIRESTHHPLVIVVDDLQWVDKTSEEFLSYLIPSLVHNPIMLILLQRPEHAYPWDNLHYYTRITLVQLGAEGTGELIQSLLQETGVSSELFDFVMSKTAGNPFFVEELIYSLVEEGHIVKEEGAWVLLKSDVRVPDTIQDIITSRIDRLQEDAKKTLQTASVIGRSFVYPILEALMEEKEELRSNLLTLQTADFVYEKSIFPELEYVFKHALVQDVAYGTLLLKRRRAMHDRIGVAMEKLYQDRLEQFYQVLAYHYTNARNIDKAYHFLKLSAMKSDKDYALWEAFHFYNQAISLLAEDTPGEENERRQLELALLMISPMIALGFPENSLSVLQEAEKLAEKLRAAKDMTSLVSAIGLYYSVKGDALLGEEYGLRCLEKAEEEQDVGLVAPIAFDLCSNYAARGQFVKLVDVAPRVISLIERSGKELETFDRGYNVYSSLLAFYGFATGYMADMEKAEEAFERALRVARQTENIYSLGLAEIFHGYVLANLGRGADALPHFEKAVGYSEKGQIFVLLGLAHAGVGHAKYYMEDLDGAVRCFERGLEIHLKSGVTYNTSILYWFLANVHLDLGKVEKAKPYAEQAAKYARENSEIYFLAHCELLRGRLIVHERGNLDEAEGLMNGAYKTFEDLQMKPQTAISRLYLVELYAARYELKKAVQQLIIARRVFKELKMDYFLTRTAPFRIIKEQMRRFAGKDRTAGTVPGESP